MKILVVEIIDKELQDFDLILGVDVVVVVALT